MSTSSASMSFSPSFLAGSRIWSSHSSESFACDTLVSSFTMPSTRSTVQPMAFVESRAACFTKTSSASSFTAIASATPGATSTTEKPLALIFSAAYAVSAPSEASLATMPTSAPAGMHSTSSSACASPFSPLGLLCTTTLTPASAATVSTTVSTSFAFLPPVTTCNSPAFVMRTRVSGSSYPKSQISSATDLR